MINESTGARSPDSVSFATLISEIKAHAKDLIQGDVALLKAEVKDSVQRATKHSGQLMTFGLVVFLSLFPLTAFFVIGLGELLDGRYWLSSLIVALVYALIGGPLAYKAFKKIRDEDLRLDRTRNTLEQEREILKDKLAQIAATMKGDRYATH
jgi:uncharacterized membrane protein YqjE